MKQTKFTISLPFFCGFYDSPLYNCDTLYYETKDEIEYYREQFNDETLEPDDLDINFKEYTHDVSKAFCEAFYDNTPDFVKAVTFNRLSSPKYYNFETDKVIADVELDENWQDSVMEFINNNKDELKTKIKEDWSNRDGFWSFMPNDLDEWIEELQKDEPDSRFVEIMLGYIMKKDNEKIYYDLIDDTLDDIYIGSYIINLKEENNDEENAE